MSKDKQYSIRLIGAREAQTDFSLTLDEAYFSILDDRQIQGGNVEARVHIIRSEGGATLAVALDGWVSVPCDRCLLPVSVPIHAEDAIKVVYGDHYDDDGETVTIDERDGELNLATILFELIAVQVPIQCIHADGECDPEAAEAFKQLMVTEEN